jgi:dihydrofolate reductase
MANMRKLSVFEFLSLDGVMQGPGAPDEDTEGGFKHGGWAMPFMDDVLGAASAGGMAETGAQLFGRKTYEIMAAYWPNAPKDDPYADHLNNITKYVASRTLQKVEWQNTTLLKGDIVEEVRKLKRQTGKNISVLGSGDLFQTLINNDLVDELSIAVFPILLRNGKRLFREGDQIKKLSLVDSKTTTTGGLILTYSLAGSNV